MKSFIYNIAIAVLSATFQIVSGLEVRFTNSTTPSTTPTPTTFCGGCQLVYEVHASVWWPTVYTNYIETVVYTVDKDSGSTIGSAVTTPNATAIEYLDYGVNFTSVYNLRDGGAVQYTYLNTLPNGPATTIIQYNEITMNASNYQNGYVLSTLFYNETLKSTVCKGGYFTKNGSTGEIDLPRSTQYSYTTVVPFTNGYNMSNVITYGIDSLASYVATRFNLSVPACTSNVGGGVGTLKVGVTALTSTSVFFAQAQVTAGPSTTSSPLPPSSTEAPTRAVPTSNPSPAPSPSQQPQQSQAPPSESPGVPEPEPSQTPVPPSETVESPATPQTLTTVQALPTTEIVIISSIVVSSGNEIVTSTIEGILEPTGLQTITTVVVSDAFDASDVETSTVPLGSYIASLGGISADADSTTSTSATGTGSPASSQTNVEFVAAGSVATIPSCVLFAIVCLVLVMNL